MAASSLDSKKSLRLFTQLAHRTLGELLNTFSVIAVSREGIVKINALPTLFEVFATSPSDTTFPGATVEEMRSTVERNAGLAALSIWSIVEHFVRRVAWHWLRTNKASLSTSAIQKLKFHGDYLLMAKPAQLDYLIMLLEQQMSTTHRDGIAKLNSLLEPFGLDVAGSEPKRRHLFELQKVRNVIAHCNGLADKRFKVACPWNATPLHSRVVVTQEMLFNYVAASTDYVQLVLGKICDQYGVQYSPNLMKYSADVPHLFPKAVD
jgi:hypothetical protein